jgi:dienelactone hydrolase
MNDRAHLLPTRIGLLGGVVTEPDDDATLSVVILPGRGGDRSGVNQMWTRTARALAENGAVVFRPDYPGRGDGAALPHDAHDIESAMADAVAWFAGRGAGRPLVFIGECYGARLAVELASGTAGLAGVVMVAPSLYGASGGGLVARARRRALRLSPVGGTRRINRHLRRTIADVLRRAPVVALVGDRDSMASDVRRLAVETGGSGIRALRVESIPGLAIHGHRTIPLQEEGRRRIVSLVASMVAAESRETGRAGAARVSTHVSRGLT